MLKLIKDFGIEFVDHAIPKKIRFGQYECSKCKQPFKARTSDVKAGKITTCGCLTKLNNNINDFKLIKDLGIIKQARYAIFKCKECNNNFKTRVTGITTGKTKSCGCLPKHKTHGLTNTRLYETFQGMKSRCYKKGRKDQKHYYDKNIKICKEWLDNSEIFFKWALRNGYKDNLTIERIDGLKDYSPDNCKFESYHIQATNKPKIMNTNTSGYKGVTFVKTRNKYNARIMINGKRKLIGNYNTAREAGQAYDDYIINNNLKEYILNKDLLK